MTCFLFVQYTQLILQSRNFFIKLNLSLHFNLSYFLLTLYSNMFFTLQFKIFIKFLILLDHLLLDPIPFLNNRDFILTLNICFIKIILQKPNHPNILLFLIIRVFSEFGFFCLYFYPFRRPRSFFPKVRELLRRFSLNLNHKCFSVRSTLLSPFRLKSFSQLVLHDSHFFDFAFINFD